MLKVHGERNTQTTVLCKLHIQLQSFAGCLWVLSEYFISGLMWAESKLHSPPIAVSFKESYDIFGELLLFLHINKIKKKNDNNSNSMSAYRVEWCVFIFVNDTVIQIQGYFCHRSGDWSGKQPKHTSRLPCHAQS